MIPKELKVLHTAIAAQLLQNYIIDMRADNWFTGVFKNFVNNFLKQFKHLEHKFFDLYFEHKEEETVQIYDIYENYLKTIAKVPIWEMKNAEKVINAYLINQSTMLEEAEKITKTKEDVL